MTDVRKGIATLDALLARRFNLWVHEIDTSLFPDQQAAKELKYYVEAETDRAEKILNDVHAKIAEFRKKVQR